MQNLGTLRQLSLGDLADDGRREKIMPSLMATSLRWRTHSAWNNCSSATHLGRMTWVSVELSATSKSHECGVSDKI